ncbi:MAG TPA: PrsW family glutamic-type intramembrane protease [Ktedonobacterales bacterium]
MPSSPRPSPASSAAAVAPVASGTHPPGYPVYAQGIQPPGYSAPAAASVAAAGYAPSPYYAGYSGYGWPAYGHYSGYGYPSPFMYPSFAAYRKLYPSRAEDYAQVVSGFVLGMGVVAILFSVLVALVALVEAVGGTLDSLPVLDIVVVPLIAGLAGGGITIYYGIRGLLRKASPRFTLPNPLLFVGLTVAVLIAAILQWHLDLGSGPGPALASLPEVLLSGILPALAILAFVAWRLHYPATRRHVWMSLIYGCTLAPLLAILLEVIFGQVVGLISPSSTTNINPRDPSTLIHLLLELSVGAPLIEEGVKPLAAIVIMPRLRTPMAAFLVGLAGGIGFDMFETTFTYIGTGQADWVIVALVRVGAGLLHGLGAGMVALGWYYFINGRGVRLRWLRGFGCLVYAVLQHAIFNGSTVLVLLLPDPVVKALEQPFSIGQLPLQYLDLLFLMPDVLILIVLIVVMQGLMRGWRKRMSDSLPVGGIPAPYDASAAPAMIGGLAR